MAIARLSMKTGDKGKAAGHAAYVAREGQYASRLERGEVLEAKDSGNMPAWAEGNPQMFWAAADAFERKNGTAYREMEIALPRELDSEQRVNLVNDWVQQEIGDRHPYQWAIHTPSASDGAEQPHVHLMFSERRCDGIERDPEQYFKRYNSKKPERGGARKGYGEHAGQTRTLDQRREELKALRERWQERCNHHLELAGQRERIDMRSYQAQGVDLEPERKMLPSEWRDTQTRGQVLDFRAAKAELTASREAVLSLDVQPQAEAPQKRAEPTQQQPTTPRPAAPQPQAEPQRAAQGNGLTPRQEKLIEANRKKLRNLPPRDVRQLDAEMNGAIYGPSNGKYTGYLMKRALPAFEAREDVKKARKEDSDKENIAKEHEQKIKAAREQQEQTRKQIEQHEQRLKKTRKEAESWTGFGRWMHDKGIWRNKDYAALEKRFHDEQKQLQTMKAQHQEQQRAREEAERAAAKPLQEYKESWERNDKIIRQALEEEKSKIASSPVYHQYKRDVSEQRRELDRQDRERAAQQQRDYDRLAAEQRQRRENAPRPAPTRSYGPSR